MDESLKKLEPYMQKITDNGYFYNPMKLLSFDRPLNFVSASRSIGKTTNVSALLLLDYLINGNRFVYVRRTKDELDVTCKDFFNIDIINKKSGLHIYGFRYQKGHYEIQTAEDGEWEVCGYAIPLSLEDKYKSGGQTNVRFVVWDEFIPDDDTRYLGTVKNPDKEYHKILSLYVSLDRSLDNVYQNKIKILFLGNTLTVYNPIFLKLNIPEYIEENTRYIRPKNQLWAAEILSEVKATADIEKSYGYRLSDDYYKKYAYKNAGRDTDAFIEYDPEARYIYTLILNGEHYGVLQGENKKVYIGKPQPGHYTLSLSLQDHNGDDLMLIQEWRSNPMTQKLKEYFTMGKLYFMNKKVKNAILKYLQFT